MAYQLIYTSYPMSLVNGRTGFSTVARTREMSEKLSSAIERCSVYDVSRGVVYTHRILNVGGKSWHVLSRITDSGVDYTNRNNYIAHHLALLADEISGLANPAEILMQWNGWRSSWSEPPKYLPPPEGLDAISASCSLPAENWRREFGDCGAAAILNCGAANIIADVSDSEKLLKLFSESSLLEVNPADAWKFTFTTSFSAADNPADFYWKAYPENTGVQGAVIDLKRRTIPQIPACRAAEYARSGVMNNRERFNLTVSAPPPASRKFDVVDTQSGKDGGSFAAKLIGGAVALSVVLVAGVFGVYYSIDGASKKPSRSNVSEPVPVLKTSASESREDFGKYSNLTSGELKSEVSMLIEKCEFQKALDAWDCSVHAKNEPNYRVGLLGAIGYKADNLMRYSENIFMSQMASDSERARAIENVFAARRALDIDGVPRIAERMKRWNELNKKIKK